jgi:hypothetical protein
MMLARMLGIRDAGDLVGEAKLPGRADGSGGREIRCSPDRAERNRYGESQVGTEKLKVRKPADDRDVGDEIFGDPRAAPGAGGGVEITAALRKNKHVQEIDTPVAVRPTDCRCSAKTANYPNNAEM